MNNVCTNIIRITFFDSEHQTSESVLRTLKSKCEYIEYDLNSPDGIIKEYKILSKYVAPLDLFQWLSYNFKIDVIGVSYEFESGYIDNFEFYAKILEIEEKDIDEELVNNIFNEEGINWNDSDLE